MDDQRASRPIGIGIAVGVAVGLAAIGLVYSVIAIPIYLLAQSDPHGLDRPFLRKGLLQVAIPIGLLLGVAAGSLVGTWYARGGRLPTDRTPFDE